MKKEMMKLLFPEKMKLVEEGKCPFCKKVIDMESFADDVSKREFEISGLCQECQDSFFTEKT